MQSLSPAREAWYRQQAEQNGECAIDLLSHETSEDDKEAATSFAREATHYANLVIGPYEMGTLRQDLDGLVKRWTHSTPNYPVPDYGCTASVQCAIELADILRSHD